MRSIPYRANFLRKRGRERNTQNKKFMYEIKAVKLLHTFVAMGVSRSDSDSVIQSTIYRRVIAKIRASARNLFLKGYNLCNSN